MRNFYALLQILAIAVAVYPFIATNMFGLREYDDTDAVLFIIVAVAIFIGAGAGYRRETKRMQHEQSLIKCPNCAERIQPDAKICRFCKKELN